VKLKIPSAVLKEAVAAVARSVDQKISIPAARGILMEVRGGHLHLTATDFNTTTRVHLSLDDAPEEGEAVVAANTLLALTSRLPFAHVTIESGSGKKKDSLIVKAGSLRTELRTESSADYPLVQEVDGGASFMLPGAQLAFISEALGWAVAGDTKRPALQGVHLAFGEGGMVATATDGRRLMRLLIPAEDTAGIESMLFLPHGLQLAAKLFSAEMPVNLRRQGNMAVLEGESRSITLRLLGDDYPQVDPLVANFRKQATGWMELDRLQLSSAVDRAAVVSGGLRDSPVLLTLQGDSLVVSSESPDTGTHTEKIPVEAHLEGDHRIGFNSAFLTAVLKHVPSDRVHVELGTSSTNPWILTPVQTEEGLPITAMVFPVRIGGDE
jgi:DNA polymerase III subunit beta